MNRCNFIKILPKGWRRLAEVGGDVKYADVFLVFGMHFDETNTGLDMKKCLVESRFGGGWRKVGGGWRRFAESWRKVGGASNC